MSAGNDQLLKRICASCGCDIGHKRITALFCDDKCKERAARARKTQVISERRREKRATQSDQAREYGRRKQAEWRAAQS